MAFTARTSTVYGVPLISAPMVALSGAVPVVVSAVQEVPPLMLYSYPLIPAPPVLVGAVNDSVADALPRVACNEPGAPGTAAGVMLFEAADSPELPTLLVAWTVKV